MVCLCETSFYARDPIGETSPFDALVKALRVVCWRAVSVEKYSLRVELSGEMIGLILHRHDLGHLGKVTRFLGQNAINMVSTE